MKKDQIGVISMPWEEKTVEQTRRTFVDEVHAEEESFSELCRRYGITRATGYKWVKRDESGEKMNDRSHCAFHVPNKTGEEMEGKILVQRKVHPAWGGRKIKRRLEDLGEEDVPAASTVTEILKRNGCIDPKESLKHKAYARFEKEKPNDLWQTDFKGYFTMGNGRRCYPLGIVDDHSRLALGLYAMGDMKFEGVQQNFTKVFRKYGLPRRILCDNGNPWGNSQCIGYTSFELWLMRLGILPIHGRMYHPQTQGKEERFNQTMKKELISRVNIHDLFQAQEEFDPWLWMYNNERPHESLKMDVPAKHYEPSPCQFPEKLREWEYRDGWEARKVNSAGFLHLDGRKHFLGEAFADQMIGIKHSSKPEILKVSYCGFLVARYSQKERLFVSKKIYRLQED
jgi:transposase InsO family protein